MTGIRAQQRGIPPLVDRWLDEIGEEEFDGHGCVRLYFSHCSVREMERVLGQIQFACSRDTCMPTKLKAAVMA